MILVPAPLPDELFTGLLGRLCILNGYLSPASAIRYLGRHYGELDAVHPRAIIVAAAVWEMPVSRFASMHSLLPWLTAFATRQQSPERDRSHHD